MNIEKCFTAYPDYEITAPVLVPTCRPDYSGYETRKVLNETRRLNQELRSQLVEMNRRLTALESYRDGL